MMLELSALHAHYGHIHALRGIDIAVQVGEVVTLIGANGAGKSTLMMSIFGEPRASQGRIIFDDEDIKLFLDAGKGNAMWAAGLAMIAIGNSEAMIGKVIRNYETETDASKLQREWRSAGDVLIKNGRAEVELDDGGIFDIVFPDWDGSRHPEGFTHGSYRGGPGGYQW